MQVKHSKYFSKFPGYSIEWGNATWTVNEVNKDRSIRNRYDKLNGGYNHVGSKEIPWIDFNRMINESIIEKQFSNKELKLICKAALLRLIKNLF